MTFIKFGATKNSCPAFYIIVGSVTVVCMDFTTSVNLAADTEQIRSAALSNSVFCESTYQIMDIKGNIKFKEK